MCFFLILADNRMPVRLIWMVLEMGGRWSYICCLVWCCFEDLFNIARCILVLFPSSFFAIRLVSVHLVHLYSRSGTNVAWRKFRFILSDRSDFHMIDNLSIAVHLSLVAYWCHFHQMRSCFRSAWTFPRISENHHLEWKCHLFFIKTHSYR